MRAKTVGPVAVSRFALIAGLLAAAAPALHAAPINYGTLAGSNVSFGDVTETTQSAGDPDELWSAPISLDDQLLFFPTSFIAESTGVATDETTSQLSTTIMANPGVTLDTVEMSLFGDALLEGIGSAATQASLALTGTFTVTGVASGPIAPVVIPFSATFVPNAFELPSDLGETIWSGGFLVDIASVVPFATTGVLTLVQSIQTASETGTTARAQLRVANGPDVTVQTLPVPEPTISLLLAAGLLLARQRPRRR